MKTLRSTLLMSLALASMAVQAQSADEIVTKSIDAVGGKDIISKIRSVYIESSVDVNGMQAPSVTYILYDKGTRSELDFNGQKIVQAVSDKGGWVITPGQTGAQPMPDEQVKATKMQYQTGGPLYDYAAKGSTVSLLGKDTAAGVESYKLKLTTKDSTAITYYIDTKTYYINKLVNKRSVGGQDVETTATFSDYKKSDLGYVMPWSQQVVLPQVTLNITNKKIEENKPIDESLFDMPK